MATQQQIIDLIIICPSRVIPKKSFNPPVSVKIEPELKHSYLKSLWIYGVIAEGDRLFVEVPGGHELTVEQVCQEYKVEGGSQVILDAIHRKFLHEQSGIGAKTDRLPVNEQQ